jgi:hypothetical protein
MGADLCSNIILFTVTSMNSEFRIKFEVVNVVMDIFKTMAKDMFAFGLNLSYRETVF